MDGVALEEARWSRSYRQTERSHDTVTTVHPSRNRSNVPQTPNHGDRPHTQSSLTPETNRTPLLYILRLLQHNRIRHFIVPFGIRGNTRQALGEPGASFRVEGGTLPLAAGVMSQAYRDPNSYNPTELPYFVDHTGETWHGNTEIAYKLEYHRGLEGKRLRDTLNELRILCHKPLNTDNIVRLLGVAWVADDWPTFDPTDPTTPKADQLEWPTIVLEKAPYGTLHDLIRSEQYKEPKPSLKIKLDLCLDVLKGILALHDCEIVHTDIKCRNVLVYMKTGSRAVRDWRAKLSDFGSSIILSDHKESPPDGYLPESFLGTEAYLPPEAAGGAQHIPVITAKSADIWCWGMLLWEVMVDGKYHDETGRLVDSEEVQHWLPSLRRRGTTCDVAREDVKRHLESHDSIDEKPIASFVDEILEHTLKQTPRERWSADEIVERRRLFSRRLTGAPIRYDGIISLDSTHLFPNPDPDVPYVSVEGLDDLPFFDLRQHLYHISLFRSVPARVASEIKFLANTIGAGSTGSTQVRQHQAQFHLALCYAVGFGVEQDYEQAYNMLMKAARSGCRQAREVSSRFPAALGLPIKSSDETREWLRGCALDGSMIARRDLATNQPCQVKSIERDTLPDLHSPGPFLKALRSWDLDLAERLMEGGACVDGADPCGATALHWLSVIPASGSLGEQVTRLTRLLYQRGMAINRRTRIECNISCEPYSAILMPARSTPLEWAIANDMVNMVEMLMDWGGRVSEQEHDEEDTLVALAAQYHSYEVLHRLSGRLGAKHVNAFDAQGLSAFYYAVRPDSLERIFRYEAMLLRDTRKTYWDRQREVLRVLLEAGSNMQVDQKDRFSCFHLLATADDDQVFEIIRDGKAAKKMIDKMSQWNSTPLNEATRRGNLQVMKRLLDDTRVNPAKTERNEGFHALHLCTAVTGPQSVTQAEQILAKHPRSLHARTKGGRTLLHIACKMGNQRMIEFSLRQGAKLLDRDGSGCTPLGVAIMNRSASAVEVICNAHKKAELPLVAVISHNPLLYLWYSRAIPFLLEPGVFSTPNARMGNLGGGCLDDPFSKTSERILDTLLKYEEQRWFYPQLLTRCFDNPFVCSDFSLNASLKAAVRLANMEVFKRIQQVKKSTPNYTKLVHIAIIQLRAMKSHIASDDQRVDMIKYLWGLEEAQFDKTRSRQQTSTVWILRYWHRLHYFIYKDAERELYIRQRTGQVDERLESSCNQWRGRWDVELYVRRGGPGWPRRFWHYIQLYLCVWALLVPMIYDFSLWANDSASPIQQSDIGYLVAIVLVVS
ncbi:MAG: hypothetical protein Q9178_005487 [Gyalolechia marmorata]